MDLKLFKKTVDELDKYLLLILLWDWGEPFLNPKIFWMIDYAHRRGIKLVSSTNGHIFANGNYARKVVESGLDALIFSVDGVTQETYQQYRSGGHLESVMEGIRNVVAEKRRQKSATPLLNFRFIVAKHNEHELPHLEGFARALEVDLLTFRKFFAVVSYKEESKRQEAFDPDDSRYHRFDRSSERPGRLRVKKNPCKNLWNCPAIHWDGTVCSCCCDFDESYVFGNLTKQSFEDIWFGQASRDMRRTFRRHWQDLPLCKNCSYAFKGGDMGRKSVTEAVTFTRVAKMQP
jgi:radical SAM protein with 4Fe4S-binding SPASM domain